MTLTELLESVNTSSDVGVLDKIDFIKVHVSKFGLELLPPLSEGSFETPRIMRKIDAQVITAEVALGEISSGESDSCEFKSSFLYDRRRAKSDPSAKLSDLKSEGVCFSSLKTLCGFLNADGGVLFVGVEDNRDIIGVEDDLRLFKAEHQSNDHWELHLRNLVQARFVDGKHVNGLIRCAFLEIQGHRVVRIQVSPRRSRLCFLKDGGDGEYRCFVRQGNQTSELKIFEIEEYIGSRAGR